MSPLSTPSRRLLIRVTYLLPAISGAFLLLYALIPHLYFIYDSAAYETLNSFSLVGNAFSLCFSLLNGSVKGSASAMMFSYIIIAFAVLFWIGIVIYALMAIPAAICSCIAFHHPPTSSQSNMAKRWFRFFCPNRALYVISNLMLLLSAAFPHLLLHFYRSQLGYDGMTLHFFGPSDLLLTALLVLLNVTSFLALLPTQSKEHLDLYRLYKAKDKNK